MTAATPRRYRKGLVVGKFSPLHRGHELVIGQALAQCETVMVLGYSLPELAGCGRARREAWVGARFPGVHNLQIDDAWVRARCSRLRVDHCPMPANDAADAVHQRWLVWLLDQVLHWRADAMFGSEPYLQATTARMADAWGHAVAAICVDPARSAWPISARAIRADIHAQRHWLAPQVYRDFVPRIALLGGESTGKTTLAQTLAERWHSVWVPEYGRERWELSAGKLTLADLLDIARVQIEREDTLHLQATPALPCDTSPLTTLGYAGWMFGARPPALQALAQRRYDWPCCASQTSPSSKTEHGRAASSSSDSSAGTRPRWLPAANAGCGSAAAFSSGSNRWSGHCAAARRRAGRAATGAVSQAHRDRQRQSQGAADRGRHLRPVSAADPRARSTDPGVCPPGSIRTDSGPESTSHRAQLHRARRAQPALLHRGIQPHVPPRGHCRGCQSSTVYLTGKLTKRTPRWL